MARFLAVIHNDHGNSLTRKGRQAMGVGLSLDNNHRNRSIFSDPTAYIKVIVRDGKEHFFVQALGEVLVTLVHDGDGKFSKHYDIPN